MKKNRKYLLLYNIFFFSNISKYYRLKKKECKNSLYSLMKFNKKKTNKRCKIDLYIIYNVTINVFSNSFDSKTFSFSVDRLDWPPQPSAPSLSKKSSELNCHGRIESNNLFLSLNALLVVSHEKRWHWWHGHDFPLIQMFTRVVAHFISLFLCYLQEKKNFYQLF